MGKYYCDYCDIYLTHDSMSARKAHNTGRNHISNVRDYFASLGHDTAQSIIDQIVQSHENGGRAAMMAAPSMRLGAGFMNPMGPAMPSMGNNFQQPPFPPNNFQQNRPPGPGPGPGQGFGPGPGMNGGPPQFRPPFPPSNMSGGPGGPGGYGGGGGAPPPNLPPFPPSNGVGGPGGFRPPPMGMGMGMPPMGGGMGMPPMGMNGPSGGGSGFSPSSAVGAGPGSAPGGAAPGAGGGGGGAGAAPGIHPDRLRMMGA